MWLPTQHNAYERSFPVSTTIPQVARTMREILTTTADEAGRATRFVQRTSPLGGATFSQTLVFGFLGNPQASLEELTQTAATLGVGSAGKRLINALRRRLRPACNKCCTRRSPAWSWPTPLPSPYWHVLRRSLCKIVPRSSCPMPWRRCGTAAAAARPNAPAPRSNSKSAWRCVWALWRSSSRMAGF